MKFLNKETGLQLIINDVLVSLIASYGMSKYPKEFGGLLLGRYINDNKVVIIEDSILPKKYKSSKYSFERGSEGLKQILEEKYNAKPSLIYVGEWHTHPDGPAKPSSTDMNAMSELANHKNVLITNPVLMILEIRKKDYNMEIYISYHNRLLRYDSVVGTKETQTRQQVIKHTDKNKLN